ncbi:MarR family transcriptional regulator [Pseudonocardia acidicola]|uniref:MarR family winged helix-turn-helix transcriptional regulator n=1 Tax=Pseudonocardia acidicola TaxID=2724939 RepID=UPI00308423B3
MQRGVEPADALIDAVMSASRALVAVAARSLAAVDEEVTLPQYRALVVLGQRGALRPADLATALAVTPSTATRMCDRLVAKGLIGRERSDTDRREVRVGLSAGGRTVVDEVTRRRRAELGRLLGALPADRHAAVVAALRSFADAAGEVPEPDWAAGLG